MRWAAAEYEADGYFQDNYEEFIRMTMSNGTDTYIRP
jgi:hypothetical protein